MGRHKLNSAAKVLHSKDMAKGYPTTLYEMAGYVYEIWENAYSAFRKTNQGMMPAHFLWG